MNRFKLPKRKNLGKGYIIQIKLVTNTELMLILKEPKTDSIKQYAGAWVDTDRIIYIDKNLTKAKQWEVYWHELLHAIHDIATLDKGGI